MKVVIVGVGALGSHVVQFMRNVDCELAIVDFDKVEKKNTLSQFHMQAGKKKTASLRDTMRLFWKRKLTTYGVKLTGDNADELLGDAGLVVDCLDNAESRTTVGDFCRVIGVPCVHGALAADGGMGRVVWSEKFRVDEADGGATCEDGEHLPFIALTAAQLAYAAQLFLTDGKQRSFAIYKNGTKVI